MTAIPAPAVRPGDLILHVQAGPAVVYVRGLAIDGDRYELLVVVPGARPAPVTAACPALAHVAATPGATDELTAALAAAVREYQARDAERERPPEKVIRLRLRGRDTVGLVRPGCWAAA